MKSHFYITCSVIFLTFAIIHCKVNAQSSASSKVWTLEECIQYAKENNLQIKQNDLNVSLSNVDYFQSKMNLLPSINASAFGGNNNGQRLDQFNLRFVNQTTQTLNLNLQGNVLLFAGLQNINRIKQNKYNLESAKYNAQQNMNDISLNIANAYMQLLFAGDRLEISRKQMLQTQNQVDRLKVLYENGAATKGDLLNIEAQLTNEEINLTRAQNQLDLSKLNLIQLLNLQDVDIKILKPEIIISDNIRDLIPTDVLSVFSYAVSNQPSIKSAEFKILSNEKQLAATKGAFSPTISAVASIGSGYSSLSQRITDTSITITPIDPTIYKTFGGDSVAIPNMPMIKYEFKRETLPFTNQITQNYNAQVGLSVSVPILNFLQNHSNLKRAKIALENSRIDLEIRKNQLRNTIQSAYNDAFAGHKTYLSNKKNVEALSEALKYAEERFSNGAMNSLDYNNAKNSLNNAEIETLISKYEYLYRVKIIDFYMGKELKF